MIAESASRGSPIRTSEPCERVHYRDPQTAATSTRTRAKLVEPVAPWHQL
jgi:hypothetical protein